MKNIIMLSILILSGCAHVIHGDTQDIIINTSDKKRVKATVQNDKMKKTYILPATITVPRSTQDLVVTTIGTDCITSTKINAASYIDPIAFGNVLTLGLGFIQDAKGAMWKYDNSYTINVKRDNACMNKVKKLNAEILNLHQGI